MDEKKEQKEKETQEKQENQQDGVDLLTRYGIKLGNMFGPSAGQEFLRATTVMGAIRKELSEHEARETAKSFRNAKTNPINPQDSSVNVVQNHHLGRAEKALREFERTLVETGAIYDPETMAWLGKAMKNFDVFVDDTIEHELVAKRSQTARNPLVPPYTSKAALFQDYVNLRDAILSLAKLRNIELTIPAKTGHFNDKPTDSFATAKFYKYLFTVNETILSENTSWIEIAYHLDLPLITPDMRLRFLDVIDYIKWNFGIDFYSDEDLSGSYTGKDGNIVTLTLAQES